MEILVVEILTRRVLEGGMRGRGGKRDEEMRKGESGKRDGVRWN